jgi:hypothetical protein
MQFMLGIIRERKVPANMDESVSELAADSLRSDMVCVSRPFQEEHSLVRAKTDAQTAGGHLDMQMECR